MRGCLAELVGESEKADLRVAMEDLFDACGERRDE